MQYIGKIDRNKLGKYARKIMTENVVLTEERKKHIYQNHFKDYHVIINNLNRAISNPEEILEDRKYEDTILLISKLKGSNLNVVVKLNTTNNQEHPENSIMTAWLIRNKNLEKLKKKSETIYKNE